MYIQAPAVQLAGDFEKSDEEVEFNGSDNPSRAGLEPLFAEGVQTSKHFRSRKVEHVDFPLLTFTQF